MISKRSKIAVIGAGKIAYSLVNAIVKNGYKVELIISSNYDSAKNLAKKFYIKNYSDKFTNLNNNNRIVFISVPDNQIKIIANKLARLNINVKNSLFIHFSGVENISNLISLRKKGALTASFHIMQTFPSKRIVKVDDCYVSIETENKFAERFLFKLAKDLKLKPFRLSSEEKILYHLTGVFASNFLVGNIFSSENIFNIKKNKITYNNFDFLSPIIKSTFKNLKKLGSSKALSGPIERGDLSTVKKHISSLKRKINSKKIYDIYLSYIVQSINLMNVVSSKHGKLSEKHLELRQYLLDELKKISS